MYISYKQWQALKWQPTGTQNDRWNYFADHVIGYFSHWDIDSVYITRSKRSSKSRKRNQIFISILWKTSSCEKLPFIKEGDIVSSASVTLTSSTRSYRCNKPLINTNQQYKELQVQQAPRSHKWSLFHTQCTQKTASALLFYRTFLTGTSPLLIYLEIWNLILMLKIKISSLHEDIIDLSSTAMIRNSNEKVFYKYNF